MSDLIRREDALDAFEKKCTLNCTDRNGIYDGKIRTAIMYEGVMEILNNIPSAEPEEEVFEWCHDCKEYDQEKHCCHRWTKVIRQTVEEMKAEPERKKGKWIEYPDCLWYDGAYSDDHIVCSECEHVFSICDNCTEEFDFCPHCGAEMRCNNENS